MTQLDKLIATPLQAEASARVTGKTKCGILRVGIEFTYGTFIFNGVRE